MFSYRCIALLVVCILASPHGTTRIPKQSCNKTNVLHSTFLSCIGGKDAETAQYGLEIIVNPFVIGCILSLENNIHHQRIKISFSVEL